MKGEAVSLFATRFSFQSTNLAIGINGKLKAFYPTYNEAFGLVHPIITEEYSSRVNCYSYKTA